MKYQDNMNTNNELCQILQEQGTGNAESGTRYYRNREQGTWNKILQKQGTRNRNQVQDIIGTGNKEKELGTRYYMNREQGTWNKIL